MEHSSPDATSGRQGTNLIDNEPTIVLLRRAQSGDSLALDALSRRYLPRLRQWASGRLPNYARDLVDTEDLVQDAFVRTLSRLERLDPKRNEAVLAYFRRAVMNRMRDEIRRPHRVDPSVKDPEDIPHQGASPLEIVIGRETVDRFEAAFSRLSTIDRELVMARIELHLTYQEIADLTGKPSPDAARVAVGRALVFLAQEMAQEA